MNQVWAFSVKRAPRSISVLNKSKSAFLKANVVGVKDPVVNNLLYCQQRPQHHYWFGLDPLNAGSLGRFVVSKTALHNSTTATKLLEISSSSSHDKDN
jgi:hypothetical protein